MSGLFSKLKEYLGKVNCHNNHFYPNRLSIIDCVKKDNTLVRISYCFKCEKYREDKILEENWSAGAIERLRKNEYRVHSSVEEARRLSNSLKRVFEDS
jgi:hypothetical protein